MNIQMEVIEQYFYAILFIMPYKMLLALTSVSLTSNNYIYIRGYCFSVTKGKECGARMSRR